MTSRIRYDADGPWTDQDPADDESWELNFRDPVRGPLLDAGENIGALQLITLVREDAAPITTEQWHHGTVVVDAVRFYVTGLLAGFWYVVDVKVVTDAAVPRTLSRRLRIVCKDR